VVARAPSSANASDTAPLASVSRAGVTKSRDGSKRTRGGCASTPSAASALLRISGPFGAASSCPAEHPATAKLSQAAPSRKRIDAIFNALCRQRRGNSAGGVLNMRSSLRRHDRARRKPLRGPALRRAEQRGHRGARELEARERYL